MVTLTVKTLSPTELITVTVLAKVPIFPTRFMATSIVPLVPGGRSQGNGGTFAAVQPQDALTAVMVMGTAARLLKVKVKFTLTSPGLAVMDLLSASAARCVSESNGAGAAGGKGTGAGKRTGGVTTRGGGTAPGFSSADAGEGASGHRKTSATKLKAASRPMPMMLKLIVLMGITLVSGSIPCGGKAVRSCCYEVVTDLTEL